MTKARAKHMFLDGNQIVQRILSFLVWGLGRENAIRGRAVIVRVEHRNYKVLCPQFPNATSRRKASLRGQRGDFELNIGSQTHAF